MSKIDPRLDAMSTEALNNLKCQVVTILESRAKRELRFGGIASFMNTRTGKKTYMEVTRINAKSISGSEVNADGVKTGMNWRVAPTLITIEPSPPWSKAAKDAAVKADMPVVPAGADRPRSSAPTF